MDETEFRALLREHAYTEPEHVARASAPANAEHTHDYAVRGLILEGEMTIHTASGAVTCGPGEDFELARGTSHSEAYGSSGAKVLIGRKVQVTDQEPPRS